jgi:p21-activated kinase 2
MEKSSVSSSIVGLPEEIAAFQAEDIFKREDPSKYYEVISRMAKGS